MLKKWDEDLTSVPIAKPPKYDVSYSYDGVLVMSARAREVIVAAGMSGMEFRPLQAGLFSARPSVVVAFDAAARETRFEKPCPVCGTYEEVAGATPVFLKPGAVVPDNGFARTDLEFGSGDEKMPLVLCGDQAAQVLKSKRLKGLRLTR